jgi:cysteine-rich repeat protein
MSLRVLALALALALRAMPAGAICAPVSSTVGLCSSVQANTCFIDIKQCPVVAGSTLDFGTQDVVLRQGSTLDVGAGAMTILARSLTLQPGTALLGHGGSISVRTENNIGVLRPSQGTSARVDVSAPVATGTRIELISENGTIEIAGALDARGTNTDASGGSIGVSALGVLVSGDVRTTGGVLGSGGEVKIDAKAGNLTVSGTIIGLGGSGGPVELTADGTIEMTGIIDIRATTPGNDGGTLTVVTMSGPITLGGKISMQGNQGTTLDGGANGGDLHVFSGAGLTISGMIDITGAPPDGEGGEAFLMSALGTVQTGMLLAQGRGTESDGGNVEFDSHGPLTLGQIDLYGGGNLPDLGGTLQATAWCNLTVPGAVTINAQGQNGKIGLRAGGLISVAGNLKAAVPIVVEYRTIPPMTAFGTFVPSLAPPVQNLATPPCGGFPPPGCGDGTLQTGEECDPPPGNTTSCDGCSSTCKFEVCGNDTLDCGEECDDGNTNDGDGCHGDCSRIERCGDGVEDGAETCDDGNDVPCDGCSSTCQLEACGNGVVECDEECDPPNVGGCSADCSTLIPPGCGNGTRVDPEECDDGNTQDADGCSHQCHAERCGNNTLDPGEDCDDANTNGCDDCSPTCKTEGCGNGVIDCGEECDDGAANGAPGGSCLPDVCVPGPTCSTGGEQPCIPCATTPDCDPLNACGAARCDNGVCTPVAPPECSDDDVCNGVEICDPASGCKDGPALTCDDGDDCSVDDCDPVSGCSHVLPTGYALPGCRLLTAKDIVDAALEDEINARIRTKLLKKIDGVQHRVAAAVVAGDNAKKVRKALKAAARQINAIVRLVTKQRGKKIAPATADEILAALNVIPPLLKGFTP